MSLAAELLRRENRNYSDRRVAERVGWIENQSASLEEALEELSLVLEERDVLEPLQRVTSFRKRATSFRKAGPESQAL